MTAELAALSRDVEAALAGRGARRRGKNVRFLCPSHADHNPSADFDPVARVWVCRVCHEGGGVRDLARRLGLNAPNIARPRVVRRVQPPPPGIAQEHWENAWTAILETARRQDQRLAPHVDVFRLADWLRRRHQLVREARRVASALGAEDSAAWNLARLASRVDTLTAVVEAALDAVRRDVA